MIACSAGNHAQGVALSATKNGIKSTICIPAGAPLSKVEATRGYGGDVVLVPGVYDDAYAKAVELTEKNGYTFVHPFNDEKVIAGQGTIGLEILEQEPNVEAVFVPIGGGGLISGVACAIKSVKPECKVYGVQAAGAPSMFDSINKGEIIELANVSTIADGIAVKKPGNLTFKMCQQYVDGIVTVTEDEIATAILTLIQTQKTVAEGAGATSVAAVMFDKVPEVKGKNIVCIISGGNNDIARMQEMKERSMIYEGLQHYFIVDFPQRAGALREFLVEVLGPTDDITRFEYTKNNNKAQGPALVGIELKHRKDYSALIQRMKDKGFTFKEVNKDEQLFQLLI